MKKHLYITLTILTAFIYKAFLIGILSNETFFIAIIGNIIIYSLLIMGIPLLIALNKKENYWERVNKYTSYTLTIFLVIVILPEIYLKFFSTKPITFETEKNIVTDNREIKKTWKQFLKDNNIVLDITKSNKYETLQQNNVYTNYYYYITVDFPDNWPIDRGNSEVTILRALVKDSALSLSLNVVPNKNNEEIEFSKSPLKFMNESTEGNNYAVKLKEIMKNAGMDVYDLHLSEQKFRSKNYLKITYSYDEITDNTKVKFNACMYQTMAFDLTYTFSYGAPTIFYNQAVIDDAVFSANYIKTP
jgi:hypothetical protein